MRDAPDELTAADAMQAGVKIVLPTMTVPELEERLLEERVSGFPVVDDGKLVGVVSRSDVVRRICDERQIAHQTSDFYFDETGFHEEPLDSFKDIADRVGETIDGLTVGEVMVGDPYTASLDQPISQVASRMVEHHVHRLPVVDRGTLVGIITSMDLVRLIAQKRILPPQ